MAELVRTRPTELRGSPFVSGDAGILPRAAAAAQGAGQAGYLAFLDLDGDGFINAFDVAQFRTRFGSRTP